MEALILSSVRLDFATRRGHLIAAVVQAKSSLSAEKTSIEHRHELEAIIEESEVAEIQAEVLQALESNPSDAITEEDYRELHERFMEISEVRLAELWFLVGVTVLTKFAVI